MTILNFIKRHIYTIIILFGLTITFTGCEKDEVVSNDTFDCISGNCKVSSNGTYISLADCQSNCSSNNNTYECFSGDCITSSNGLYTSLVDCQSNCSSTISGCGSQSTFTDPRDGQTYDLIEIGYQCWLAKNLNYETGNSWCYDNDASNCYTYGRLYDWQTALTACPNGWHLPSDDEWLELIYYFIDLNINIGPALKSTYLWKNNGNGTNSSGFSGLPGGYRKDFGSLGGAYNGINSSGFWWTTIDSYNGALSRELYYQTGVNAQTRVFEKTTGLSCRCVKD